MPANTEILTRYKSYVGRLFTLRQCERIPVKYDNPSSIRIFAERTNALGDSVLIVDEDNSRVKVISKAGDLVWIGKYYLHKEVENPKFFDINEITEAIGELVKLSEVLPSSQSQILRKSATILRTLSDTFIKEEH